MELFSSTYSINETQRQAQAPGPRPPLSPLPLLSPPEQLQWVVPPSQLPRAMALLASVAAVLLVGEMARLGQTARSAVSQLKREQRTMSLACCARTNFASLAAAGAGSDPACLPADCKTRRLGSRAAEPNALGRKAPYLEEQRPDDEHGHHNGQRNDSPHPAWKETICKLTASGRVSARSDCCTPSADSIAISCMPNIPSRT
jgi:hypothetical protein